jgi:branched-chain amino acid transport system substrate-binding protein
VSYFDRRALLRASLGAGAASALPFLNGCQELQNGGANKIAVLLAETGPADYIGRPEREVIERLVGQYRASSSGRFTPTFDYFDTGTNPGQAEAAFAGAASDQSYIAVIGPSTSGESMAVAARTAEYPIPVLSLAASKRIVLDESQPDQTRDWVFKFAQNDDLAANKLLQAIAQQFGSRRPRLAFLYSNDAFGRGGSEVFAEAVAHTPMVELQDARAFPPTLTEADPIVNSLRNIDGVVIWGTAPGPALLVRSLRARQPGLRIFLSHGNATHQFLNDAGPAAENAVLVGSRALLRPDFLNEAEPRDQVITEYRRFWETNFPQSGPPNHFGGHAYDAVNLLMRVIDGQAAPTRPLIRSGLETHGEFVGVTGTFRFTPSDHAGLTTDSFEIYSVSSGDFRPLGN